MDLSELEPWVERTSDLLRDFAAAIVPMPGHPEQGGLYLVRGMANAVARYPFASAPALRAQATALVIGLAHALSLGARAAAAAPPPLGRPAPGALSLYVPRRGARSFPASPPAPAQKRQ